MREERRSRGFEKKKTKPSPFTAKLHSTHFDDGGKITEKRRADGMGWDGMG